MQCRRPGNFWQAANSGYHKPLETGVMPAAQMFGDDHEHGLSNGFAARIAKQLLGMLAPG